MDTQRWHVLACVHCLVGIPHAAVALEAPEGGEVGSTRQDCSFEIHVQAHPVPSPSSSSAAALPLSDLPALTVQFGPHQAVPLAASEFTSPPSCSGAPSPFAIRFDGPAGLAYPAAKHHWATTADYLRLDVEVRECPHKVGSTPVLLGTMHDCVAVREVVERRKLSTLLIPTPLGRVGLSFEVTSPQEEEEEAAPGSVNPTASPHSYRGRLVRFLSAHHPKGLSLVDDVIKSKVPELTAFTRLYRVFGVCDYADRLRRFAKLYGLPPLASSFLASEGGTMPDQWKDREEEYMREVVLRYGPEGRDIDAALRWAAYVKHYHLTPALLPSSEGEGEGVKALRELWYLYGSGVATARGETPCTPPALEPLFEALSDRFGPEPDPRTYLFSSMAYVPPREEAAVPRPAVSVGGRPRNSTRIQSCVGQACTTSSSHHVERARGVKPPRRQRRSVDSLVRPHASPSPVPCHRASERHLTTSWEAAGSECPQAVAASAPRSEPAVVEPRASPSIHEEKEEPIDDGPTNAPSPPPLFQEEALTEERTAPRALPAPHPTPPPPHKTSFSLTKNSRKGGPPLSSTTTIITPLARCVKPSQATRPHTATLDPTRRSSSTSIATSVSATPRSHVSSYFSSYRQPYVSSLPTAAQQVACSLHPSRPVEFYLPRYHEFVCSRCVAEDHAVAGASRSVPPSLPVGPCATMGSPFTFDASVLRLETAAVEAAQWLSDILRWVKRTRHVIAHELERVESRAARLATQRRAAVLRQAQRMQRETEEKLRVLYASVGEKRSDEVEVGPAGFSERSVELVPDYTLEEVNQLDDLRQRLEDVHKVEKQIESATERIRGEVVGQAGEAVGGGESVLALFPFHSTGSSAAAVVLIKEVHRLSECDVVQHLLETPKDVPPAALAVREPSATLQQRNSEKEEAAAIAALESHELLSHPRVPILSLHRFPFSSCSPCASSTAMVHSQGHPYALSPPNASTVGGRPSHASSASLSKEGASPFTGLHSSSPAAAAVQPERTVKPSLPPPPRFSLSTEGLTNSTSVSPSPSHPLEMDRVN